MSPTISDQNGEQITEGPALGKAVSHLSLSSQTVHADDFLNEGQDVAPPLHVSTTYRYNSDPSKLRTWAEKDVYPASILGIKKFLLTPLLDRTQS